MIIYQTCCKWKKNHNYLYILNIISFFIFHLTNILQKPNVSIANCYLQWYNNKYTCILFIVNGIHHIMHHSTLYDAWYDNIMCSCPEFLILSQLDSDWQLHGGCGSLLWTWTSLNFGIILVKDLSPCWECSECSWYTKIPPGIRSAWRDVD